MSKINKVIKLLKNRDVRSFALYTLRHPGTMFSRESVSPLPSFLGETDIVRPDELKLDEYSIRKLTFPGILQDKADSELFGNKIIKIRLAGIEDQIDIEHIEWLKEYTDPEDVAAFHRFFWLYRLIWENGVSNNHEINATIKRIICSWIDTVESKDKSQVHSEVWQTYSVVERLISWVTVLGLTEAEQDKDKKIIESIIRQLDHIHKNFEYYGEEFTSNHFCNNGRGLYVCGTVLGIEEYVKLGKKIITNMIEKIVPDNTFLREGSVHYQFLITKWMCDCLWIARECGDVGFEKWLEPRLIGLTKGCRYFLIKGKDGWQIPLIGDISPDLIPNWIIGVPWVAEYLVSGRRGTEIPNTIGYHSFIKCCEDTSYNVQNEVIQCEGNNDWQKIEINPFVVFVHVNNSLFPNNLTGHFHHDSGAFVAYYEGLPLFIDSGRVNYDPEGAGIWMKSYLGHNLFCVDGCNPEPDMRSFYTKEFLNSYLGETPNAERNGNSITASVYGGNRIKGMDIHQRRIEVNKDSIIIEDHIEGHGSHEGVICFHIAEGWKLIETDGAIRMENDTYQFSIKSDECSLRSCSDKDGFFYGNCSDEYGKLKHCVPILGKIRFDAPYTITTWIERI